ncbi:MAG: hypothetical protein WD184_00480 [Acidimicrobiia bacterium]
MASLHDSLGAGGGGEHPPGASDVDLETSRVAHRHLAGDVEQGDFRRENRSVNGTNLYVDGGWMLM